MTKRAVAVVAWLGVIATLALREAHASPRTCAVAAVLATLFLLARFALSVVDAKRGDLAWTRLPLGALITAEGVLRTSGASRGGGLREAAFLGVFELALLGVAIAVTARALRAPGADPNVLVEDRIAATLARFVPEGVARVAAFEVVLLRYALSPRRPKPEGTGVFGYAAESPLRLFVVAYPLLLLVNEVAIQAIVPGSHPIVRAVAACLDVYTFVWLLGVYRSAIARPHVLEGGVLRVHRGALGSVVLGVDAIESATALDDDGTGHFPGKPLRMDVGGPRRAVLAFRDPVVCRGFLGSRIATRIVVSADAPDAFCDAIRTAAVSRVTDFARAS